MDPFKVLTTLESFERRITTVRWKSSFERGKLVSGEDPGSFVRSDTPEFFEGTVAFDFVSGRYRGDLKMVNRWIQGAAPYIAHEQVHTYDGLIYRSYQKSRHGVDLPLPECPSWGHICREYDPILRGMNTLTNHPFVRWWAFATGVAWMQPFAWTISDDPVQRLSDLIRGRIENGIPLTIEEENGFWKVTTPTRDDSIVCFYFDPKRNCALVEVTVANGNPLSVYERRVIELQRINDAIWLPKQIVKFGTLRKPAVAERTVISEIEAGSKMGPTIFDFSFPIGTRVEDQVRGESYNVGPNLAASERLWLIFGT